MQLDVFNGNVAVPIDGRIGFGIPAIGSDEPVGPQLLAASGDPSGVVTAPAGTLALDFGTPALWQNTDGASAWVVVGGGAALPVFARTLYVNNSMVVVGPDGSIGKPFPTIQAALDTAGVPAGGLLDAFLPYNIRIQTGLYDEDLIVPAYRSINFIAEGGPVALGLLGPGAVGRDITLDLTGVPAVPGIEPTLTFRSTINQGIVVSGTLIVSSAAGGGNPEGVTLTFENVAIQGYRNIAPPTPGSAIDATGFLGGGQVEIVAVGGQFFSNDPVGIGIPVVVGPSGPPASLLNTVVVLARLVRCRFEADSGGPLAVALLVGSYGIVQGCQFDGDLTFIDDTNGIIDSSGGLTGFFDTGFSGGITFTGVAPGDFRLDADTNFRFTTAVGILGGATTKTITSGGGLSTYYTPSSLVDWMGTDPVTLEGALDRIASLIGPIP